MEMQDDRGGHESPESDVAHPSDEPRGGPPTAGPPVRIEQSPPPDEEMGGEQPCQAHRFWGLEEE